MLRTQSPSGGYPLTFSPIIHASLNAPTASKRGCPLKSKDIKREVMSPGSSRHLYVFPQICVGACQRCAQHGLLSWENVVRVNCVVFNGCGCINLLNPQGYGGFFLGFKTNPLNSVWFCAFKADEIVCHSPYSSKPAWSNTVCNICFQVKYFTFALKCTKITFVTASFATSASLARGLMVQRAMSAVCHCLVASQLSTAVFNITLAKANLE